MRRPKQTVTAVAEFPCSPSAVWQVLTNEQDYHHWFGYPEAEDLVLVDPSFVVGAKLHFKGLPTMIITALTHSRELVFSNTSSQFTFTLDPNAEGTSVSITIDSFSEGVLEDIDKRRFCSETLRALKKVVGVPERIISQEAPDEPSSRLGFSDFLQRVFAGYQRPVSKSKGSDAEETYSTLIENTEAGITIARRALAFALVLTLFFFVAIGISLTFKRSDIVPSSGLSLMESENVNKYVSTLLRIGDSKQDLERKLSCQGNRVITDNNVIKYTYDSLEKGNANAPLEQIFVLYDAYGNARRIAYFDNFQSTRDLYREPSTHKLKTDLQYYELEDFNIKLSPTMNIFEVEKVIGVDVSAYTVEKSGEYSITTLYFGKLICDDIFSTNYRSQIVVVLDEEAAKTSVSYYNQIDSNNPFPLDEFNKPLKRQYAWFDEYLADRYAFERSFLLFDTKLSQTQLILNSTGGPLPSKDRGTDSENDQKTTSDPKEDKEDPKDKETVPVVESYGFRIRRPYNESRSYRYEYDVVFTDGIATSVTFKNELLAGYARNTLTDLNKNSLYHGMSLTLAMKAVGILPSAMEQNLKTTTLFYGAEQTDPETGELVYPLSLVVSREGDWLLSANFYEPDSPKEAEEGPAIVNP